MNLPSGSIRFQNVVGLGLAITVQTRVTFVSTSWVIFAGDFDIICGGPVKISTFITPQIYFNTIMSTTTVLRIPVCHCPTGKYSGLVSTLNPQPTFLHLSRQNVPTVHMIMTIVSTTLVSAKLKSSPAIIKVLIFYVYLYL